MIICATPRAEKADTTARNAPSCCLDNSPFYVLSLCESDHGEQCEDRKYSVSDECALRRPIGLTWAPHTLQSRCSLPEI